MAMTLITTNTSSGASTSSFTSSIDNTYKLFIFKFININPSSDNAIFGFNGSIDSGSNYNVTKTSSYFGVAHYEGDSLETVAYSGAGDLAEGTAVQQLARDMGNGANESMSGELYLFNPSNTTYVKHFYSVTNTHRNNDGSQQVFAAGYINETDDVDAVQFSIASGNFDGTIKMYGVG